MTEKTARQELSTLMNERFALKREYDAFKNEADRLEYEYYCTYESDDALLTQWLNTCERADKIWTAIRVNVARQSELRNYLECFRDPHRAYI